MPTKPGKSVRPGTVESPAGIEEEPLCELKERKAKLDVGLAKPL